MTVVNFGAYQKQKSIVMLYVNDGSISGQFVCTKFVFCFYYCFPLQVVVVLYDFNDLSQKQHFILFLRDCVCFGLSVTKRMCILKIMFQGCIVYYKPADFCWVINVKVNHYGLLLQVWLKSIFFCRLSQAQTKIKKVFGLYIYFKQI